MSDKNSLNRKKQLSHLGKKIRLEDNYETIGGKNNDAYVEFIFPDYGE